MPRLPRITSEATLRALRAAAGRRFDAAGATSSSTMRAGPAGSRSLFMPASSSNPRRSSRFWSRPAWASRSSWICS